MRKIVLAVVLIAAVGTPLAFSNTAHHSYAQTAFVPQSDEFNATSFTAPFVVRCGQFAASPCPDPQGPNTWSLNSAAAPGVLRIWSQFGSLLGTAAQSSDNARNLILQPFSPNVDFTVTTKVSFPANQTSVSTLGQTAGLIIRQDDANFLFVGRVFTASGQSQLQFVQEVNGADFVSSANETGLPSLTLYLRLQKTGTLYQASVSLDNVNFTPFAPAVATPIATATATINTTPTGTLTATPGTPTSTATAVTPPSGYIAAYATPEVGVFSWGGTDARVSANTIPADFDWFRVGNSSQPGPTAVPTSTGTVVATSTSTAAPTSTSTAVATATSTATATATSTSTATSTPVPTATPKPPKPQQPRFQYVSLWYHTVRTGTFDHLVIQARPHRKVGVWVTVHFPSGVHFAYYEESDSHGRWEKEFSIPRNALSKHSSQAVANMQLWRGNKTIKNFVNFTIIK